MLPVDFTQSTSLDEVVNKIISDHPESEEAVFYIDAEASQLERMQEIFNSTGIDSERLHFNRHSD